MLCFGDSCSGLLSGGLEECKGVARSVHIRRIQVGMGSGGKGSGPGGYRRDEKLPTSPCLWDL